MRCYNQPWYTVSGPNAWPYKEIVARWVQAKKWRIGEVTAVESVAADVAERAETVARARAA